MGGLYSCHLFRTASYAEKALREHELPAERKTACGIGCRRFVVRRNAGTLPGDIFLTQYLYSMGI